MREPKSHDVVVLIWARSAIRAGLAADLRINAELSQAEVAALVGVTPSAICKWETGQRVPRGDAALRYARFLYMLVTNPAPQALAA
jgi:transcriptional regulator with XRE-family HTH domain